jgi:C1A family cysteine protease
MYYGWIPDIPDQRDYPYAQLAIARPVLPKSIDLRSQCSPVENQEELGSCTACALVGNLEFLKREKSKRINFSKLFLYYNERAIMHTISSDSGSSLRNGIKSLVKLGCCKENLCPYVIKKFDEKPSDTAYTNALDYQITSYFRIHTKQEMKHTLANGYPFVFGIAVYESFESEEVTNTGIVPFPKTDERLVGGHAIMAVGYDDEASHWIIRNSWGASWGDNGYCYLPYEYASRLATDFWTVRDME